MHIYSQFGALLKSRLSFRHQKQVQYELVQDALEHQKDKLASLENAERESRRLDEALERGGRGLGDSNSNLTDEERIREREAERERERDRAAYQSAQNQNKRSGASGGFGLFNAVKHSLSGMMDVDPEATRRANIAKTRDNISQVSYHIQTLRFSADAESSSRIRYRLLRRISNTLQLHSKPILIASRDRRSRICDNWLSNFPRSTENGASRHVIPSP